MSNVSIRCIRGAFFYLGIGIGLGVLFAFDRPLGGLLRPVHAEANLWGFVTLMIYGMAYHMVPRFMGRPLPAPQLAEWQSWLAIGGSGITISGWLALIYTLPGARLLLLLGGGLQVLAVLLFGGLVLATIAPARQRSVR
jgi:hypothetical protein